MSKKDITLKNEGALAVSDVKGFEGADIQKEDLIIPRAALLQALSPEIVDGATAPDGKDLKTGMIINSLTREILPEIFIPVFYFPTWIRFNPRDNKSEGYDPAYGPGDVIWHSNDRNDLRVQEEGKFGPNGEPPLATMFMQFFSYFPGVPMPVVVSFSKTSIKSGKRLLSLARFSGANMFAQKYKLGVKKEQNDKGTYFVLTIDLAGKLLEDDTDYKTAATLWEQYHTKPIQVHEPEREDSGEELLGD